MKASDRLIRTLQRHDVTRFQPPICIETSYAISRIRKDGTSFCINTEENDGDHFVMIEHKTPKIISYSRDGCGNVTSRHINDTANTLHASRFPTTEQYVLDSRLRIRRLTPRERFRLMGVDDRNFDTIRAAGISDTALCRLAGNSIVEDVLYHIFRKLFAETESDDEQLKLF